MSGAGLRLHRHGDLGQAQIDFGALRDQTLIGELVQSAAREDDDVGVLMPGEPVGDRLRRVTHRGAVLGDDMDAGVALIVRRQRVEGGGEAARRHDVQFADFRGLRIAGEGGRADGVEPQQQCQPQRGAAGHQGSEPWRSGFHHTSLLAVPLARGF
ncbi:hypothetical protein GCM10020258_38510 [Sphingomonas yabuuchiae]